MCSSYVSNAKHYASTANLELYLKPLGGFASPSNLMAESALLTTC